jgi:4-amino-4-deoxy-L-arabinose transferase-like glycosyltransferase
VLFGFFLGLPALAKGPAGIILCGGAVFFWAIFTKQWRDAFRLLHPAVIAPFCLTALPWYILCARRNPEFFRIFIIEHNFKRYLTPEFQHIQPFWYYGPILVVGLFPWIGMTFSAVSNSLRHRFEMKLNSTTIFFYVQRIPSHFFSISKSSYPATSCPLFRILFSDRLCIRGRAEWKSSVPAGFAVLALTPVALMAAIGLTTYFLRKPEALHRFAVALTLLVFLAISVALVFVFSGMHRATMVTGILAWLCFIALTNRVAMPWLDPQVSSRPIAGIFFAIRNCQRSQGFPDPQRPGYH